MSNNTNTFSTLDRELSVRFDIPKNDSSRLMSIQNNMISKSPTKKSKKLIKRKPHTLKSNPVQYTDQSDNKKTKYVDTSRENVGRNNFRDFYAFGNRAGYNYNTDQESDLRYSESTRRKTLPSAILNNLKKVSRDVTLDTVDERGESSEASVMKLVKNQDILRRNDKYIMDIGTNMVTDTAAKIPKASADYWDNTKRRNLDTSTYTDTPMKYGGRGFGDVGAYGLLYNGIGLMTRQDNPDANPRSWDDDRIYMTNHNYHYPKQHVTDILPCGVDTRYLNQKMV
jgi:hypothetical protein